MRAQRGVRRQEWATKKPIHPLRHRTKRCAKLPRVQDAVGVGFILQLVLGQEAYEPVLEQQSALPVPFLLDRTDDLVGQQQQHDAPLQDHAHELPMPPRGS